MNIEPATMNFPKLGSVCLCTLILLTHTFTWAEPAEQQDADGWFCEQGEQNKEWLCVQNETIQPASNENRDNVSSLSEPEKRDVRPLKELLETQQPATRGIAQAETKRAETKKVETTEVEAKLKPVPVLIPARPPEAEPVSATQPRLSDLPLYVQLSYKPGQPINISKLPPEFYVVQLMSLTEKANLEAYFAKHNLIGLSAARVESNDEILYVLLLGIYESYANARQASENMPSDLNDIKPWIRSLRSLQKAMLKADEISGSADY